jgi:hydrogenase-4 component B
MPWTAGMFAVGALAVSGLPPLNGFVSEWLVYLGLLDAVASKGPSAWAAMPAVIMLAMAGALALASFVKAGALMFLGSPRTQPAAAAHESGPLMRLPMLSLAAVCVLLALAPVLFWPAVARAVGAWHPAWASANVPAPLASLGAAQASLLLVAVAAAAMLLRKVRANGVRSGLTWDCGYAVPTSRMQYSSGSFAGIAAGWFTWVLNPQRIFKRPRGLMPLAALRLQRVPETVLELVIVPASGVIARVSRSARRLQHGSLQAYILYVLAAITALGVLVSMAGVS